MAMTPVINEVNRIQVGSPVPIGSSEADRAQGEASEALGKAIFDLGNALDNEKKQKVSYEPIARRFADEVEIQMLQNSQRLKGASPMDDRDGVDHSNQVFGSIEDIRLQYRDMLPEEAKPLYDQYVTAAKVQHVGSFMQTGADASVQKGKNALDESVNKISEKMRINPVDLPLYLNQIALTVEESDSVLVSQKDAEIRARQAGAVKSLIDMHRQEGVKTSDPKAFDRARMRAVQFAPLFSKEAFEKEMKEINDEQYNAISRSRSDIDWNRKNSDYIETKQQADNTIKLSDAFANARTPEEKLKVERKALDMINSKKITLQQYEEAKGFRQSVDKFVDAGFESRIINQIIQEKGALYIKGKKTAVQQINEAYQKKGGITAQKHSELIQLAARLRDDKSMTRDRMALVKEYMDVIGTYTQNSIMASSDENFKRERARTAAMVQVEFLQQVLTNPNATVESIYEKTVPAKLDISFSKRKFEQNHIPGLPESAQSTPEAIGRSVPYLKQDLINAAKSGDPAKIRQATEALKRANQQAPKGTK